MWKIIISATAEDGIQETIKERPIYSREYKEQMEEADRQIDRDHYKYANAYKKSASYLAR